MKKDKGDIKIKSHPKVLTALIPTKGQRYMCQKRWVKIGDTHMKQ